MLLMIIAHFFRQPEKRECHKHDFENSMGQMYMALRLQQKQMVLVGYIWQNLFAVNEIIDPKYDKPNGRVQHTF